MAETLSRNCICCNADLEITITNDGEYDIGHYWGTDENGAEMWECGDCGVGEEGTR